MYKWSECKVTIGDCSSRFLPTLCIVCPQQPTTGRIIDTITSSVVPVSESMAASLNSGQILRGRQSCWDGATTETNTHTLDPHWFSCMPSVQFKQEQLCSSLQAVQSPESGSDPRGDPRGDPSGHSLTDNMRREDRARISYCTRITSRTHCQYLPRSLSLLNARARKGNASWTPQKDNLWAEKSFFQQLLSISLAQSSLFPPSFPICFATISRQPSLIWIA